MGVVKPLFVVSSGLGIVDTISEKHFEMLNVGKIGLRGVNIPKV